MIDLFQRIFKRRLSLLECEDFASVADLSQADAYRYHRRRIESILSESLPDWGQAGDCQNRWFYRTDMTSPDEFGPVAAIGPMSAAEIIHVCGNQRFFVWRQGMADWLESLYCHPFQEQAVRSPV
ncbi:MAG: hypothetical protein KDN22_30245 [Verrucomicrobiae bacterium]|nr:hypothetical protein [Verrucomicrobiae bacterium]